VYYASKDSLAVSPRVIIATEGEAGTDMYWYIVIIVINCQMRNREKMLLIAICTLT